jgi:predicted DNA-binding protein
MSELLILLPPELQNRLEALSKKLCLPIEACIQTALTEYAENWEDHLLNIEAINNSDAERQAIVCHSFSSNWHDNDSLHLSS